MRTASATTAGTLFATALAQAQPVPPPPPPQIVEARVWSPPADPSAFVHDGFYLRFGLGAGWARETMTAETEPQSTKREVDGVGVPIDFALGGTIGPGFVLGGALQTTFLSKQDRSVIPLPVSEAGERHGATLSVFGLYADWYPDPTAGLHLQGMLGAGSLLLSDTADNDDYLAAGTAASLGFGKEWWIAPETSVGILGHVDWASLKYDEDVNIDHTVLLFGLMGTATYH